MLEWSKILIYFSILIIFNSNAILPTNAIKFSTAPICLSKNSLSSSTKIICEDPRTRLFIQTVKYSNDHFNQCSNNKSSNSTKSFTKNSISLTECSAYPKQELSNLCNAKHECFISLDQRDFVHGFDGSNCDFKADILTITYECLPIDFKDPLIPKYNICPGGTIEHPITGFILSPNYPKSHESNQYCQLTLKIKDNIQKFEIFLIDMELESISKRTSKPTDYLQINNKEKLFGERQFNLIYDDSHDAVIVFNSDTFFNKRGFLLYFQAIQKQTDRIDLYEDMYDLESTTSISTIITTTQSIKPLITVYFNNNSESILNNSNISNLNITESVITKININDLYSTAKYLNSNQNDSYNSFINDYTLKAIVTLIGLVIILGSIIVFLLLTNRKRFFSSVMKYKEGELSLAPINAQFYDSSAINGYLEANSVAGISGSFILASSISNIGPYLNNLNQPSYNKLKKNSKSTSDSLKFVLLNKSIEPVIYTTKPVTSNEVYDEIGEQNEKLKNFSKTDFNKSKENLSTNFNSTKVNEYCYVQTNGLISGEGTNNNEVGCSNQVNIQLFDSKLTPPSSSFHSPISDSVTTSTPSVPKTLPPSTKNDKLNIQNDYEYDTLNEVAPANLYRSCYDENENITENISQTLIASTSQQDTVVSRTIINENDYIENEQNLDYQIPSNLLIHD